MLNEINHLQEFVPVALVIIAAIGFAVICITLPSIIGTQRKHNPVKDSPYECGLPPLAEAHARFSVKFYVVAMLFILFDIESVFLLGWAAVYRNLIKPVAQGGIGFAMLGGAMLFLFILEIGHVYAWKKGALDWAPSRSTKDRTPL